PDYMAPEQAVDAGRVDIRADIYGLGCTLYHLLGGRVPFPDRAAIRKLAGHAEQQPTPLEKLRPPLPAAPGQGVARLRAKRTAARYQTPAEVAAALEPWCRAQAETAELPRSLTASARRFFRSRRRVVAAVVSGIVVSLLATAVLSRGWLSPLRD